MRLERFHPGVTLVLCWVQIGMLLLSPFGFQVCREIDGSSHVEQASDGCRETADSAAIASQRYDAVDGSSALALLDPSESCSDTPCDDAPVTVDAPRPETQRILSFAGTAGQIAITPSIDSFRTIPDLGAIAFLNAGWIDSGPPQQVERVIRTTVLIL